MSVGLLAVVVVCAMAAGADIWRVSMLYLLAAVLVTSTAHPWYVLWTLALLPLRFSLALWVLSATLPWSYAVLLDVEAWRVPRGLRLASYLPVYAALIADGAATWRRRGAAATGFSPEP